METYIYTLKDPISNEIRYVGKSNNPKQRFKAHLNKCRKHQKHKSNWIEKLKKLGLKPIFEIINTVPIDEWKFWEKYWISQMKTWGFNLINYTEGGDGCTFSNQTSFKKGQNGKKVIGFNDKYIKIFEFNSASDASSHFNINRGSISSSCNTNNRSKTIKDIAWFYDDFLSSITFIELKKIIDDRFNKKYKTNSGSFKKGQIGIRSKKVLMFDLDWNFIQSFESAREAGKYLGVTGGAIQYACTKSKNYLCKKYKWKYEDTNIR